jgi:hypothetical protein
MDAGFGEDVSWILPGRVAWSWWSQETGDDLLQKEYVDSASDFGWEYVLVDARWDQWPDAEEKVEELVRYARDRGVGVLLWYNSGGPHNWMITETPRGRMHESAMRRAEFQTLSNWGVKGIKVDFFHSDKQDRIQQYLDILADARDFHLLVSFHGCTIPRGWERPYPNLMTMEAVMGAEQYKWGTGPSALDNVRLVFTRNVVGSMDYTPVTFEAAYRRRRMSYAHQLALSVLFESGWQCLADRADSDPEQGYRRIFRSYPYVEDFLRAVPVAWDETRFLAGTPDSHVVLARRHGEDWYVAGINGQERAGRPVSVPLRFLGPGLYDTWLIKGGATAQGFELESSQTTAEDALTHTMDPRDGFVVRLTPQT